MDEKKVYNAITRIDDNLIEHSLNKMNNEKQNAEQNQPAPRRSAGYNKWILIPVCIAIFTACTLLIIIPNLFKSPVDDPSQYAGLAADSNASIPYESEDTDPSETGIERMLLEVTKLSGIIDCGSSKEAPIDLESIDFSWFDRNSWAWTSDEERFSVTNKNAEPIPDGIIKAFICGKDTLLSDVFSAFGSPHKMYKDSNSPEIWILEWTASDDGRIAVRTSGQPESYPLTFAVYGGKNSKLLKLYAREQDRLAEIPNGLADLSVLSKGMSMEEVLSLLPKDGYRRDGDGEWSLLINDRDTHHFFYARFENGHLAALDDSGIDVDYAATYEEYQKVVSGMTLSEVVAILGRPLYCPTSGIDSRAFRGPDDGFWVIVFRNDAETGRKVVWDIQG